MLPDIVEESETLAEDSAGLGFDDGLDPNSVRVLRQEAVGMYEVAVLEAGSPARQVGSPKRFGSANVLVANGSNAPNARVAPLSSTGSRKISARLTGSLKLCEVLVAC